VRLSFAGLHFGEEPPLSGKGGSGTVFFTGCPLRCPFCQNYQISREGSGRYVDKYEFADILLKLQDAGAENINLVTPSHMLPSVSEYIDFAETQGLKLPAAWNSSGYETTEVIEHASSFIDIWLPDIKTLSSETAARIYGAPEYPEAAKAAVEQMVSAGSMEIDSEGRMLKGVIVRHLVLPGELESTRTVMRWFSENLYGRAMFSLMMQYTPVFIPGETKAVPQRQLEQSEFEKVVEWLDYYGIEDGFYQELVPGDSWLPDFNRHNPFSSPLSKVIWNFKEGFISR